MANLQLLEYMKTQTKSGFSKDTLLAAVRKAGWQESAIQEVLRELEAPITPATSVPEILPKHAPAIYSPASVKPIAPSREQIARNPSPSASMPIVGSFRPGAPQQPARISPPIIIPAKPAITQTAAPQQQPVRHFSSTPIAIDASGNPLPAGASLSPASKQPEISPSSFGVQQMPQMRVQPKVAPQVLPVFKKSEFSKFANENSGYSAVAIPGAKPAAELPKPMPVVSLAVKSAEPLPVLSPEIPKQEVRPAAPVSITPTNAPEKPTPIVIPALPVFKPGAPVVQIARPMPAVFVPITPQIPKPLGVAQVPQASAPMKINPAFIPLNKSALPPEAGLQTKLTAASGIPSDFQAKAAKAVVANNPATIPGAFQGMRPLAAAPFGAQTVAAARDLSAGILPQSRPILIPQKVRAKAPTEKKGHKLLYAFFILLLLAGGGAFAYIEFPASLKQAEDSVQALIPSTAPVPGAVLANALAKLFSTSQLSFKANIAGAVTSVQDSSSDIRMQGIVSGDIASIFPFPASKDSATFSIIQARQTAPALNLAGNILSTGDQGIFFRISSISGTENAGGKYDSLKNAWISIDPSAAGIDSIAAVFSSPAFEAHKQDIANIIIRSQVFAVANVYNDDPGSGLYHYGIAIQKDKILPAVSEIANVMGISVTEEQKAAISASIQSANFPGFEAWINKASLTVSRIKASLSRGSGTVQAFSFDVSILPLVGNPPSIAAPEGSITLDEALNPAPPQPAPKASAKKK